MYAFPKAPQMPAHFGKFVSYYRVSTDRQGRSGLGLEAQKEAVQHRLNGGTWQLVAEFVEVESGKLAKRPQLDAALSACKNSHFPRSRSCSLLFVAVAQRNSQRISFLSQGRWRALQRSGDCLHRGFLF